MAGYNATIQRKDSKDMLLGTGALLEHDSSVMLDNAERYLLKLLALSPKARLSMKTLVDGGKQTFMEWSCIEREWLFQCLIDAPGRDPLPVDFENNASREKLRKYLSHLRDCPPDAFREDSRNDHSDIQLETELNMVSNNLESSQSFIPKIEAKTSMSTQANALFYSEDDLSSAHPSNAAASLEYIFDEENDDAQIQLILDNSNDDKYIDFMTQVAISNMLDAQASLSMKALSQQWLEKSSLSVSNGTAGNLHLVQSINDLPNETVFNGNDILYIRSRLKMTIQTKMRIAESSKKLTAKLLSSLRSEEGEGSLSTRKQQSLIDTVDDFVRSLPEDTHRPDSFSENYIFGLDYYDDKVDNRFSGKAKTKIDWETVNLDFDSILE